MHTPHSRNDDRTVNLTLACKAIDGIILMPGEEFSFNRMVGERTEKKGCRAAPINDDIDAGSESELGGGVSQAASTIYCAVRQAGLETVERHGRAIPVAFVPQDMDAAVEWNRLDYRFRNNSDYLVKIVASVSDGEVHIYFKGKGWED